MISTSYSSGKYKAFLDLGLLLGVLAYISFYNYVFFHSLADTFTAVVASGVFMVVWNARQYLNNNFYLFISSAYLFVGILNLLHVFSYVGNFWAAGPELSHQLWLASMLLLGGSFLVAIIFKGRELRPRLLFLIYLAVFFIIVMSILQWRMFPDLFDAAGKATAFKLGFDLVVVGLLLLDIWLLYRIRKEFDKQIWVFVTLFLGLSVVSFGLISLGYSGLFNYYGLAGHLLTVIASYLFYLGIVETGLVSPYSLLFKNLRDKEDELRENEELYRSLVEFDLDAIVVHNENGIVYVNPAGIDLLGAKDESELMGKKLRNFIHQDYKDLFKTSIQELGQGTKRIPLKDARIVRLDGRTIEAEVSGRVMTYNGVQSLQTTIRDLSNRKIAVEDAPDHIIITNAAGNLIYANKAAEKTTGYSWEEMAGKKPSLWGNIVQGAGVNRDGITCLCKSVWDVVNEGNPHFSGEVLNRRKSGEEYIADLHISPVYDEENKVAFFVAIERDITKLKEIDRAKTEFISLASHELRTPLASISMSSELLMRSFGKSADEKQKKYLQEIYKSTHRMSELIHTFLNVSRLEMGTFIIDNSPVDLTKDVNQFLSSFKHAAKEKKIRIKKNFDRSLPVILFDKNVLKIVIDNLLTNAIRYTPAKGKVGIEIKKEAHDILIKVSDSGCGIPLHQQHRVFSKSFRADNAKELSTSGLGLGLYLVKLMLEKTNSKIWLESTEGRGTNFFVSIPIQEK